MSRRVKQDPILIRHDLGIHKAEVMQGIEAYVSQRRGRSSLNRLAKKGDPMLKAEVASLLWRRGVIWEIFPPSDDPQDYKHFVIELYTVEAGKEKIHLHICALCTPRTNTVRGLIIY